jgi:hypothetical protein
MPCLAFALPAFCQDAGSVEKESYGNESVISVVVHDGSGGLTSTPAMVKLYRGAIPSGRQETSRGVAELVVTTLGEFTVNVSAPGYEETQKDVSVQIAGRAQVDVYLRRSPGGGSVSGVPGRPVLTFEGERSARQGTACTGPDKTADAGRHLNEAARLAPGRPDVLYAQGVLSLKQHNWTQAQTALEKATQIDPSHAQTFAALGMALCDERKYDAAILPLEKSLQLDASGTWETRWELAKAYYHQQLYGDALKMTQQALAASNGKAPEIELLLAQSLTKKQRIKNAQIGGFLSFFEVLKWIPIGAANGNKGRNWRTRVGVESFGATDCKYHFDSASSTSIFAGTL